MVVTEILHSFGRAGVSIHNRCAKLGGELPQVRQGGNAAVAAAVERAVSQNLGGQSIFLRGVGYSGAKVSVLVLPLGEETIVKMKGPAHFVERDTNPHPVGTGAVDNNHGMNMQMPDGRWATGPFMAGGSKGRHPFERGVDAIRPLAPRIYDKGVRVAAVKAGFG